MSPFQLKILMHYYVSPSFFHRADAPAYPEAEQGLVEIGALVRTGDQGVPPKVTTMGRVWCRRILSVPPPRMAFVDENNNVLELEGEDEMPSV